MASPVTYVPEFIDTAEASAHFSLLWNELNWERRGQTPRREYWTNTLGRSYTYGSGNGVRTYDSHPSHSSIEAVHEALLRLSGVEFEGCFLNGYEGKKDSLDWHADDDPGIDHSKPIAVVTLGQPREINFREVIEARSVTHKGAFGPREELLLEHGSLLLMHAGMQQTHQHKIPRHYSEKCGPRISLTFRGLLA